MVSNRVPIIVLAVSLVLVFTFVFASLPAPAQGPPPGVGLAAELAALSARVAKLEGNIVASDLVGTYSVFNIQNEVRAGFPARIASYVNLATLTLNPSGTGSVNSTGDRGYDLVQGAPWSVTFPFPFPSDPGGLETFTWAYNNGIVTLTFSSGETNSATVAVGGRVLINADASGVPGIAGRGHDAFVIATRLQ